MRLKDLLGLPVDYYPLGFLVVGVAVLLLRAHDANAWLLALLFGGFLAVARLFERNNVYSVAVPGEHNALAASAFQHARSLHYDLYLSLRFAESLAVTAQDSRPNGPRRP
jgi:hypothetical protein